MIGAGNRKSVQFTPSALPAPVAQAYANDPRRLQLAQMMEAGSNSAPVRSPIEGLARMLQAGFGAYQTGKLQEQYQNKANTYNEGLSAALAASTPEERQAAIAGMGADGAGLQERLLIAELLAKPNTNKPVSVAAGATLVDPKTGEPIFTAPHKPQKSDVLSDEAFQQKLRLALAGAQARAEMDANSPAAKIASALGQERLAKIQAETAKIETETAAAAEKAQTTAKRASEFTGEAHDLLKDLLSEEGRNAVKSAAGPVAQYVPTLRGSTRDAEVKINRLRAILTKDNLGLLKGVLSDTDIKLLGDIAAGGLDLSGSDAGVITELERLEQKIAKAAGRESITGSSAASAATTTPLPAARTIGRFEVVQ